MDVTRSELKAIRGSLELIMRDQEFVSEMIQNAPMREAFLGIKDNLDLLMEQIGK